MSTFSTLVLIVGFMAAFPGAAESPTAQRPKPDASLEEWGRGLPMDPGVSDQMLRFEHDGRRLDPAYASQLASHLRSAVIDAATGQIARIRSGSCEPLIDVQFLRAGFASPSGEKPRGSAAREFEDSFVRTEMVACIDTDRVDANEVLDLYTSPDFRRETESRIAHIAVEGDRMCVETKGVWALLDPTSACNRVRRYSAGGAAAEHSQVMQNDGSGKYQDVFFKESLKTFVPIPGGLALHYVNYSRAVSLGRLSRSVAGGKVEESQRRHLEALVARIGR
jgi:hypothetical protein